MMESQPGNTCELGFEQSSVPKREAILLSRSTILVLSGVLLGLALREGVLPSMHSLGFYVGLTGLIAYLGLEVASRRKHERVAREAHDRMVSILNSRIDKHMARPHPETPAPVG
jgi:hypothetical protein